MTNKIIAIEKFTNLQACNNELQKISKAISTSKNVTNYVIFQKVKNSYT